MKHKISVIMPVYNGEKFILEAVKSILDQTYKNFELIIVEDGSSDGTLKIVRSFKDKRIRVIRNKENLGVAKSLNIALEMAKGQYIARCDADDVNFKDRFNKQVDFLEKNLDYVLVGGRFGLIDEFGRKIDEGIIRRGYRDLPIDDKGVRKLLFLRNPLVHPTVMIRKEAMLEVGGYRVFFNGVEDYDLWFRIMKVGKLYNLPYSLIKRRIHSGVVTKKNHIKIELKGIVVRMMNITNLINLFL